MLKLLPSKTSSLIKPKRLDEKNARHLSGVFFERTQA